MVRGYQTEEIKRKLVDLLNKEKEGLSGIEISEKLGVNRVTMTKYLNYLQLKVCFDKKILEM